MRVRIGVNEDFLHTLYGISLRYDHNINADSLCFDTQVGDGVATGCAVDNLYLVITILCDSWTAWVKIAGNSKSFSPASGRNFTVRETSIE